MQHHSIKNPNSCLKLSWCAAALAIAFPVMAQEVAPKPGEIQEVVITASKRKESIQSVPMSVDAISGESLQKLNVQQFSDIEKLSPGLVMNEAGGRNQNITLRGISFNPDTGATPTVQVYWNETPMGTSDAFRSMFDIGRIEILRGPQGTLRGVTTPGGAITIATRQPDLHSVEGMLNQTWGSAGQLNTQAAVNVPLIDGKLAMRVAGLYNRSSDGVHNVTNGRDNSDRTRGGRISLLYQATKNLEIQLVHQQVADNKVNYPVNVGAPVAGQGNGPRLTADDRTSVVDGPNDFYNKTKYTSLNVTWSLASHKLSYIGGLQQSTETADRDIDTSNVIPNFSYNQRLGLDSIGRTHEMRFESTDKGFWNYMVGAYYSNVTPQLKLVGDQPYIFPGNYVTPKTTQILVESPPENFTKGSAVFTNHRFELTPYDVVELGARYQWNSSYSNQNITTFGRTSKALPENWANLRSQKATGSASYKHNFSKDIMAYASYAGGYRPGGTTGIGAPAGLDPQYIVFKPESTNSFELGFKSSLLNRRMTFDVDIFQQKMTDYISRAQVRANLAAVPGAPAGPGPGGTYPGATGISINSNADVISQGVEATVKWNILPGWSTNFSASYVNAHYNNALLYCNDSNNDGIPDSLGSYVQPGRQVSVCRSNRPLADAVGTEPGRVNMSFQSEYSREIGELDGFVRTLVRYVPPSYNLENNQHYASFTPVDLYFGVREQNHRWELSIWSQNLFNRSVARPGFNYFVGAAAGGYTANFITKERRKVGVTLRYDFG